LAAWRSGSDRRTAHGYGEAAAPKDTVTNRSFIQYRPADAYYLLRLQGRGWKQAFSQEEDDLFMPDASYEEFVAAQQ